MGRKSWLRCICGAKLHAKKNTLGSACYKCSNKARKAKMKEKKHASA